MAESLADGLRGGSAVRASDEERERCASLLAEHYTAGRLDLDAFLTRVGQALTAVNRAELETLLVDLPTDKRSLAELAKTWSVRRRRWLSVGTAVLILTGGVVHTANSETPSSFAGACVVTGVAPTYGQGCPAPTRTQRALQRSIDQAAASAVQAAAAADGAADGSRLRDLSEAAHRAADDAVEALADAQVAAATRTPGARGTIEQAARTADNAADEAARAAISADLEASKLTM